jgi:hypothetical protein
MVPAFLGGKVGAGVAVGTKCGSSKLDIIQVFLCEYLMEAQRAVKIEPLRVQGLKSCNNAGV